MTENLWDAAKAVLRGKFRAMQSYLKKEKNISNKQPNLTPKEIRERRTKTAQSQQKERNHNYETECKITLKGSYNMIKWRLSQECKDS